TLIPEVAELYREMYNNLHSRVVADVYTSIEVGENVLSLLRKRLEEYLDKEVEIDTHVDKSILGGVLVKIGDRVIDGTLKTKFENMAKSLR
ncbi:F0F1 ATP synthase subunit delta, partial [bacterium]